jgi:hypothetical protein
MEPNDPKLVVLAPPARARAEGDDVSTSRFPPATASHPCEQCQCCACQMVCTKCRANCAPMGAEFMPVVYCPEFADMRTFRPVRYLYRSDYSCEYRLRLPGTK